MKIEFKNVMPHPLKDFKHPENSVWGKTFEFGHQESILLNAQSGKGKSTFVNIIFGIRKDFDGEVLIDDENIRSFSDRQIEHLRSKKLSIIFQDLQLFPNLTVKENLLIKNNLTQHKTEEEIKAMLEHLGMMGHYERRCGHLSMGQQQRIAIIRALLQPFEFLLTDEPFSHLDEENTQLSLELIEKEAQKNKAGYLVTTLGEHHGYSFDKILTI